VIGKGAPKVLVPVILSGGAGTRLRPVSCELYPKPFIKLSDGESLLQKSFVRAVRERAQEYVAQGSFY